jgi:hypothetical protein
MEESNNCLTPSRVWQKSSVPHIYKLSLLETLPEEPQYWAGALYIGQTNGRSKSYITGGQIPCRLIKKYGESVFSREILEYADVSSLNELERCYVQQFNTYNTHNPNLGLNLSKGGVINGRYTANRGCSAYDEGGNIVGYWSSRISASAENDVDVHTIYHYIKKPNKLFKGKYWREGHCGNTIDVSGNYVYQYSKNGELLKVWKNPNDLKKEFSYPVFFKISTILAGREKYGVSCAGYLWGKEGQPLKFPKHKSWNKIGGCAQLDPNGRLIKVWRCRVDIAEHLGVSVKRINKAAHRGIKYDGFYWINEWDYERLKNRDI